MTRTPTPMSSPGMTGDTMPNITKGTLNQFTITGDFEIAASVKAEQGSKDSKQVTIRFKLQDVPLSDVINSSLKDKRINWQVGARKNFDSLKPGSVVIVDYKGGRQPIDIQAAMDQRFASMSIEERKAYVAKLMAGIQE